MRRHVSIDSDIELKQKLTFRSSDAVVNNGRR